jgi:methylenetetrahydrofolate dehydrogenase (NADP+)/methenyltetrahydrofolate cyclohydrolase
MTTILDGKWLSERIQERIRGNVAGLQFVPGLGVILVGEDPASHTYVANKEKLATGCGLATFEARLAATATFEEVREAIERFNLDERVDGILLQLPLPKALRDRTNELLNLIDPRKDADGLHPVNQGLLMRGEGVVKPCTPQGAMALIDLALSGIAVGGSDAVELVPHDLAGKHAVVVGRSILVGKPVALMLLDRNATVTVAHSKTADLAGVCRSADVLVAAVGVPGLIKGDWVKPGAIVIDVGINRLETGKLTGDVDFESAKVRAAAITPVPKGVGPMTVVMLIQNTVAAALARRSAD